MLYKAADVKPDENGIISGYFSTYDRVPDSYGDVVARGAFADTIKAREETGHPFPLCWNHDLNQIIGAVEKIEDREKGAWMEARFFDTPLAQEKRNLVKEGVVFQFSFAYAVLDEAPVELEDGTNANELRKMDLFEVSIVPIPANQNAVMTEIKSGKRNSAKDEQTIKDVISALQALINTEKDDDGEDKPEANAAAEERKESNPAKTEILEYIKSMEEKSNEHED